MKTSLLLLAALAAATLRAAEPVTKPAPAAGQQPAKPRTALPKEKEAEPFTATYAAPDKKSFADFPNPAARAAQQNSYIGFQYGTGKTEVVYVAFDPETAQDIPDRAYVFHAGSTNPPIAIRGRTEQVKPQKNVKTKPLKPERFELPVLRARIGNADVQYHITATCGHSARANVHVTIETIYKTDKTAAFILHGSLGNTCVPVPNEIKVLPLLATPELHIHINDKVVPPWIRPYVAIGEHFVLEPGKGMDPAFVLELKNKETSKVTDKGKHIVKIPPYSGAGESGAGENYELKGAKAGKYTATASIDLGPLGYPSVFTDITVPVPSKEKKK